MDTRITIGISVLLLMVLLIGYVFLLDYYRKSTWRQQTMYDYISELNYKHLHQVHYNKMKEWLLTEGEKIYIRSPSLVHPAFKEALERTELETIKELKEKFLNEHKSRDTKNTTAV